MPRSTEFYYRYMIGGIQRTQGYYAASVEDALLFVVTDPLWLEVAEGLKPKRENLRVWNSLYSEWRRA